MFLIAAALAAHDTTVTIPVGTIASGLLGFIQGIIPLAIPGILALIPMPFLPLVKMFRIDQLLANALNYAFKQAIDKVKDQNITVDVQNQIVADASKYVLSHGPTALIKWAGGEAMIKEKLEARLGGFLKDVLANIKK
jgi:hypothetical protein